MTHDEAYPRLAELVGLHDAVADEPALRAHLSGCPRCAARLADLERLDGALRGLGPEIPLPASLDAEVRAVPDTHLQAARPRRRLLPAAGALAIAATVAALLVVPRVGGPADARIIPLSSVSTPVRAQLHIAREGGNHRIRLEVTGLQRAPGARYRLWLRSHTGEVALEPFRPGAQGTVVVVMDVPVGSWTHASITAGDDPPGGGTTLAAGQF